MILFPSGLIPRSFATVGMYIIRLGCILAKKYCRMLILGAKKALWKYCQVSQNANDQRRNVL